VFEPPLPPAHLLHSPWSLLSLEHPSLVCVRIPQPKQRLFTRRTAAVCYHWRLTIWFRFSNCGFGVCNFLFAVDAGSVRTDRPIPTALGLYYYEITIKNKGKRGYIGLGLCSGTSELSKLPGWEEKFSYGSVSHFSIRSSTVFRRQQFLDSESKRRPRLKFRSLLA
jgi:hypothetical protein